MHRHSSADPLARALVSGFIASTAMQVAFAATCGAILFVAIAQPVGPALAAIADAWVQVLQRSGLFDLTRPTLYQGIGLYLAAGLLWAVAYTHYFRTWLAGPPWQHGVLFGCLAWVCSTIVSLPLADGGVLGLAFGAGPLPLLASLPLHVIYGITLTVLAGPSGDVVLGSGRAGAVQLAALRSIELCAAVGVVAGLVLGATVGLLAVGLLPSASESVHRGLHPLALVAGATVIGGALGAVVGSFCGLAHVEAYDG